MMNKGGRRSFCVGAPDCDGQLRLLKDWLVDPETTLWMAGCLPLDRFLPWALAQPNRFVRTVFLCGVPVAHIDVAMQGQRTFMSLIVNPKRRNKGIGRSVLRFTLDLPELADVQRFDAGIAELNLASRRCFAAAGFAPESEQPDEDGFINYIWIRGT